MWLRRSVVVWLVVAAGTASCNRSGTPGGGSKSAEPTFAYDEGGGCAMAMLYRHNSEKSESLVVSIDAGGIKEGVTTFNLAAPPANFSVRVNVYPRPQQHLPLCSNLRFERSDTPVAWTAIRGTLTLERFPRDPEPNGSTQTFRLKSTLEGAEFRSPDGRVAVCTRALILEATVGWNP